MDTRKFDRAPDRMRVLEEENRLLRDSASFFADLAERLQDRLRQETRVRLHDDQRARRARSL